MSKPNDETVVCPHCGEDASGPGADEVIKHHIAEKHPKAPKKVKK